MKTFSTIGIILVTLFIGLWIYFSTIGVTATHSYSHTSISLPESDTAFGGIFSILQVSDSIPHYQYKKIEDSFNRAKRNKEIKNSGSQINGLSFGSIGVYSIQKRNIFEFEYPVKNIENQILQPLYDSFNASNKFQTKAELDSFNKIVSDSLQNNFSKRTDSLNKIIKNEKDYYLSLNNFSLKDFDTKFFIERDSFYLAVVKWGSLTNNKNKSGYYQRKKISIRYSEANKQILIPINQRTHSILRPVIYLFAILIGTIIIYILIGFPIQILVNISRGKVFTEKNNGMLKLITLWAFVLTFSSILTPYFFYLLFKNRIPDEIGLPPFFTILSTNIAPLFICVLTFFIHKAFKRGYKLQQEQALTI